MGLVLDIDIAPIRIQRDSRFAALLDQVGQDLLHLIGKSDDILQTLFLRRTVIQAGIQHVALQECAVFIDPPTHR